MGGQNSIKEVDGEIQPEGEDGTGDFYSPFPAAQTCSGLPQLLRRLPQYLYCAGTMQKTGKHETPKEITN